LFLGLSISIIGEPAVITPTARCFLLGSMKLNDCYSCADDVDDEFVGFTATPCRLFNGLETLVFVFMVVVFDV
jgi:hypothetical protein